MSALTHPQPQPPPPTPTGEPAGPEPGRGFRGRYVAVVILLAGGACAAFWMTRPSTAAPRSPVAATVVTAKAGVGSLQVTRRVAGQTSARTFGNVMAPIMRGPDANRALTLMTLAKSGSTVKKGDVVAEIDAQTLQDHVDDLDDTVRQALADVRKRVAEQNIELENLQQTVRVAGAELNKLKLEAGASELRTAIDQEILQLSVAEAEAKYKQLLSEVALKKQSQQAELKIMDLTRERHARHRDRHKGDIEKFTIRAPMDGLVVMQTLFRGGETLQIQQGDPVAPGQPFMQIVAQASIHMEANINQAESGAFKVGQVASIGLDAFPGKRFKGRVWGIGALAVGGRRQNYYIRNIPIRITVEGADAQLIPDLSAWADVVVDRVDGATIVPVSAVREQGGKSVVLVKQADQFVEREVRLGLRNDTEVAVLADLQPGEEVALGR